MEKALVYSKYNDAHISPKKVAPVMDLVRGKDAMQAKLILSFDRTKAGAMLLKTLKSAIANAKNNLNLDVDTLFISDLRVNMAQTVKKARYAGRGRSRPVMRRSSHLILGLSQKEVSHTATKSTKVKDGGASKTLKSAEASK